MSWENELREEIEFTSPLFNFYVAKWKRDERSADKKLGIFGPPKFQGEIVQDLGIKATRYPITFYFDGFFHNKEAEDFFETFKKEDGQWQVVHPVKGPLILQPVSIREVMDPINNGSYTEFQTEWIEPANVTRLISPDELAASILSAALVAIEDTLLVLAQLRSDLFSAVAAATNLLNNVAGFMDTVLAELAATDALIQESYNAARNAFDNAIDAYSVDNPDTDDMGETMSNATSSPVDISTDFTQRFSAYSALLTEYQTLTPENVTEDDYNKAVAQESAITMAMIAIAQVVATSEFQTRAEVVSAIENITDIFNSVTTALDETQDTFSSLDIDNQYYSQSQSYTAIYNLFTLAVQYLLSQFFNLATEKRFITKTQRSPLEITVTEYGELGDNDFYYNLFIESNKLAGNDIILLPAGTEVVVYA